MSLAADLLHQAGLLVRHDRRRPRQANLRRGVSAAYYALFHLLVSDAVRQALPQEACEARSALARAFSHTTMAEACRSVIEPGGRLARLCPGGVPAPEIARVAKAFVTLQQARYDADCNVGRPFVRSESEHTVDVARQAFADWRSVRQTPCARVLLVGLLECRNMRV